MKSLFPKRFNMVTTQFGEVPQGSGLSYHLDAAVADSSHPQANTNQSKLGALPPLPFPPSKPVKIVGLSWPISLQDAQMIERSTVGQSCNSKWLNLRRYTLTASNFHRLAHRTRNAQGLCSNILDGP